MSTLKKLNTKMDELRDSFEEIKSKYIKRTGSPGNYKYWYKDPKTGKLSAGRSGKEKQATGFRKLSSKDSYWVAGVLANDENSTDKELINYFMKEGQMSEQQAKFYVNQRDEMMDNFSAVLEEPKI